jgi:diketogulonate reductase-like aldo/keto reductase
MTILYEERRNSMLYRTLGKTKEKVSAIGLGGYHLGHPPDPALPVRIVRSAIDRGINFMDNCWDYHLGESEKRMGVALRDGYRQKVFLMTKFDGRTKDATARQIDESLARLQTDHIDLIQYHENIRLEDLTVSSPPAARSRLSWKRRRAARFATSASPGTRTRWSICVCWTWRRSINFLSIPARCLST